jgi:hypothetical protein
LTHDAIEVIDELDLRRLVRENWAAGRRVDYLIVDEAGFLNPEHVDQLAERQQVGSLPGALPRTIAAVISGRNPSVSSSRLTDGLGLPIASAI